MVKGSISFENKTERFRARINLNGKTVYLGRYRSKRQARSAINGACNLAKMVLESLKLE